MKKPKPKRKKKSTYSCSQYVRDSIRVALSKDKKLTDKQP